MRGFTITEMLVAMVVALSVTAGALAVALSSRNVLDADQGRTTVNQNLRSGMDLVGIDVRQTGERLPRDVPVLEIVNGGGGAPDTLVLRRNLLDQVLPLCADIGAGTTAPSVVIAKSSGTVPPGCTPVPDTNGDGWPDNLEVWRSYRQANGGTVRAYVYDPANVAGEFFDFGAEDATGLFLTRTGGGTWQNGYHVADQSRVYILEERVYRLNGDILEMVLDGDGANPQSMVGNVTQFQVRAFFQSGAVQEAVGPSDAWPDLHSVEVTLEARSRLREGSVDRALVSRFFPRNVLSR